MKVGRQRWVPPVNLLPEAITRWTRPDCMQSNRICTNNLNGMVFDCEKTEFKFSQILVEAGWNLPPKKW